MIRTIRHCNAAVSTAVIPSWGTRLAGSVGIMRNSLALEKSEQDLVAPAPALSGGARQLAHQIPASVRLDHSERDEGPCSGLGVVAEDVPPGRGGHIQGI